MSDRKWFVRGVPAEVTAAITAAAKDRGMTIGKVVTEALRAHLARLGEGGGEAAAATVSRLAEIERRLTVLEAAQPPTIAASAPTVIAPVALSNGKSNSLSTRIPARMWKAFDAFYRDTGIEKHVLVQEAVRRYVAKQPSVHKTDLDALLMTVPETKLPEPTKRYVLPYPWQSPDLENQNDRDLGVRMGSNVIQTIVYRLSNSISNLQTTRVTQTNIYMNAIREFLVDELPKWGAEL
jgi:hypothetical protein